MSDEPNWDTLESDRQISNTEHLYNKAQEIISDSLMDYAGMAAMFRSTFRFSLEGVDTDNVDWNYLVQEQMPD